MSTTRERAEQQREAKLERVSEQSQSGSLELRWVDDEKRRGCPPRHPRPNQGRMQWRSESSEGLIARVRQIRRAAARERPTSDSDDPHADRLQALEARVAHIEQLLEGLQDSVHRESERHAKLIAELQAQVRPPAIGAALAEDKRSRGL